MLADLGDPVGFRTDLLGRFEFTKKVNALLQREREAPF